MPTLTIGQLCVHEQPQERIERLGPSALRDEELLALLLRTGTPGRDVLRVAESLLLEAGSLASLASWGTADFARIPGIGRVKALQLLSVIELSRRMQTGSGSPQPLLRTPIDVVEYMIPFIRGLEVEKFWVLCLNTRHRLIRRIEATSGTATASLAHPREVFRDAIRLASTAVIVVHNHPSGDPQPSAADIQVTRQLREAARILNIDLVDHVIVGARESDPSGRGHYSFRDSGLL